MFKVEIEQDYHDKKSRWLKVSHNGGAAWSLIEIRSDDEVLQIIRALQQGFAVGQLTLCPECGEALLEDDRRWECVNESCGNCR